MKTLWTKGLIKEDELELRGEYINAHLVRKRLTKLIEDKISTASKSSMSKEGYDCPNWAYKQADKVGYNRALAEVISLICD